MAANAIYTILEQHLVSGTVAPGEEIGVRADQLLTQDGTGTLAFLHLDRMGAPRLRGRFAICYVDHNTLGVGPENADDHRFLRAACEKFGVHYSPPGSGIGHQVHLERFAVPGKLLLGADSHVTTLGGIGMLAIGIGGLELAGAITGAPYYLVCPSVIRVHLTGSLPPWSSAKDIILTLLGRLAGRSNVGTALEYSGPGVATLSVSERATIANMGAELGVTTSLFPTDAQTRNFLSVQGRVKEFRKLEVPKSSSFADEVEVDLSKIEPMVALPSSPLKVVPVREAAGLRVDQVAIGSCTNGGFEDLARVAGILRGERAHPGLELIVAPASRQVLSALVEAGLLGAFLGAGCRLLESACGFCIGHGQAPATGAVSVRTTSRNYPGRAGTLLADVYLVSPETAAATALSGVLTDPRDLKTPVPRVRIEKKLPIDLELIVEPPRRVGTKGELPRGPNIVAPPASKPLPVSINCEVVLKVGDNISTDDILPAGGFLKFRSNVQEYANHTFALLDPTFVTRARENQSHEVANLIIAGRSYGQGSSREHAALCPLLLGVRVIIAKSFERIHLANLVNYGIVPLVFIDQRTYDLIAQEDYLELPWIARELRKSKTITLRNPDRNVELKVSHSLTRRQIEVLLAGGLFNFMTGRTPPPQPL